MNLAVYIAFSGTTSEFITVLKIVKFEPFVSGLLSLTTGNADTPNSSKIPCLRRESDVSRDACLEGVTLSPVSLILGGHR